ncbi:hypothetical protein HMI55_004351 [Coelomomyces lativittatus]|nr:hypothetical protein HMI55_004351 [Coelomomyces lativittatus]
MYSFFCFVLFCFPSNGDFLSGSGPVRVCLSIDPSILSHLIEPPHFKKSIPSSTSSSSPPPPKPPSSLLFPTTPTTTKLTKKPMGPIDLDKQCGVLGGTQHTPCQRAITCKNHSVGAKRMVKGRSQSYDILVQLFQRQKEKGSRELVVG